MVCAGPGQQDHLVVFTASVFCGLRAWRRLCRLQPEELGHNLRLVQLPTENLCTSLHVRKLPGNFDFFTIISVISILINPMRALVQSMLKFLATMSLQRYTHITVNKFDPYIRRVCTASKYLCCDMISETFGRHCDWLSSIRQVTCCHFSAYANACHLCSDFLM